jgi:hypothetical protein
VTKVSGQGKSSPVRHYPVKLNYEGEIYMSFEVYIPATRLVDNGTNAIVISSQAFSIKAF